MYVSLFYYISRNFIWFIIINIKFESYFIVFICVKVVFNYRIFGDFLFFFFKFDVKGVVDKERLIIVVFWFLLVVKFIDLVDEISFIEVGVEGIDDIDDVFDL